VQLFPDGGLLEVEGDDEEVVGVVSEPPGLNFVFRVLKLWLF
jgi:hypothetical protein